MSNRAWSGRGRPRGCCRSRFDTRILEYLVKLSIKRGIRRTDLFNAIVDAWKNGKASCQELTIKFRKKKNNSAVFLITNCYEVVAQFSIPEYILEESNPLGGFGYMYKNLKQVSKSEEKNHGDAHMLIKDLKSGMKRVGLKAKITEIADPKLVLTRFDDYALLASVTLSDKTGTIKLALWNERINTVSVNDEVQIENANVTMFRGEKQLRIGRNGKLEVTEKNSVHVAKRAMECISD
ncbi:MAG: hypothetical protein ACLFU9_06910 [Candidatus Bathyarchaeia archaeon]